jgi:RNA-binding protein YlmH
MDKKQLLSRVGAAPEDQILLSHALDQLETCARRGIPTHTGFLSPAQWTAVTQLTEQVGGAELLTLGGYPEAERRRCLFLPDYLPREAVAPEDYISALRLTWYAPHSLSHRDLLGSLMGLGLKREGLGDLLVSEGSCDLLLLPELSPFVADNLSHAGREALHIAPIPLDTLHFPTPKVKTIRDSVASLRLDAVAAACFALSRSKLSELIRAGKVSVNYLPVQRPDLPLEEGALIACRGLGKARLTQVGGSTRKGRISVTVERFL